MEANNISKNTYRLTLLFIVLVFVFIPTAEAANPFLILHLDAVSSQDFFRELEAGNLPNIEALFADGIHIRHGMSLFPGGTEMIYPRLKAGLSNSQGESVGWGYVDPTSKKVVRQLDVLLDLLSYLPRNSKSFWAYGLPGLENLTALSLVNAVDVLETHGYAEVLWFATDVVGHFLGATAHLESLYFFDRALGRFLPMDRLDQVNIILYADHGMSFADPVLIDIPALVKDVFGRDLQYYSYPNVFVHGSVDQAKSADQLVAQGVDFVFYRQGDDVYGHHKGGVVHFSGEDGLVSYAFSGVDPFGYDQLGYMGEALDRYEWLELTKHSKFPAIPPNVYSYFQNPNAGHFVVNLMPPKMPKTVRANKGNHADFTNTGLMVPILLKGPDFEHLRGMDTMWLNELYSKYAPVDFNFTPKREDNSVSFTAVSAHPGLSLQLSPAYRLRTHFQVAAGQARLAVEYDLYSDFLVRNWLGVGTKLAAEGSSIFVQGTSELQLGRFLAALRGTYDLGEARLKWRKTVGYELNEQLSAFWHIGEGVGLKFIW